MPLDMTATEQDRGSLMRGRVSRVETGTVWVEAPEMEPFMVACDVLRSIGSDAEPVRDGDRVVIMRPETEGGRGVVLGVIAPASAIGTPATRSDRAETAPERLRLASREIVIEAGTRLELRVGQHRIVITEDGKILIKGESIVSHARALNKVRGGAVRIN